MTNKSGRKRSRVVNKRLSFECLEDRIVLSGITDHSAAFDLIDLYEMRRQREYAEIDGDGIGIAIIDTGIDISHNTFADRIIANEDLFYGREGNFFTSSHGTNVAGVAASSHPNIGVANEANIISLQVFSETDGYSTWVKVLTALQWVREHHHEHNIKVVNMSLGGGLFASADDAAAVTQNVYQEILTLEDMGITVVSAAGNEYGLDRSGLTRMSQHATAPGIYSTLVVGAVWEASEGGGICMGNNVCDVTTASDRIVHFSQRPPNEPNVVFAPGAFILSAMPDNSFAEQAGTSLAAPMVSGTVALMQDAAMTFGGRYLTPDEVQDIIRTSADIIYDGDDETSITTVDGIEFSYTETTYPRINVHNAINSVQLLMESHTSREDRYAVNSGDSNGVIDGAFLGPILPLRWNLSENDPTEAMTYTGILGKDGRRFDAGDADVDLFSFEVAVPGVVILQTEQWNRKKPADTLLRLFDAGGNEITFNDNYANTTFSHIEAALPVGTYYVGVSGSGNDQYSPFHPGSGSAADRGYYKLFFSWTHEDLNGFLDAAVQVSFNQGDTYFSGLIGEDYGSYVGSQDVDLFRLSVPDDGKILVDIDTPYGDGYADSVLRMFDINGNEIGFSDDQLGVDEFGYQVEFADPYYEGYVFDHPSERDYFSGHTSDSFIMSSELYQGEVIYFGVSAYGNDLYSPQSVDGRYATYGGYYEVEFHFVSKDLNGSIDKSINLPEAAEWYEEYIAFDWDGLTESWSEVSNKDIDFYQVIPDTTGILEFDVDSFVLQDNDDFLDSVITVFDSNGNYLAQRDWDYLEYDSWDSKVHLEAIANEPYYFAVSGLGNQSFDPFILGDALSGDTGYYQMKWDVLHPDAYASLTDNRMYHSGVLELTQGDYWTAEIGYDDTFVLDSEDVDLYRFAPEQSGSYMIWTDSSGSWSADTVLRLFDNNGAELAQNDDDPYGGLGSFISYEFQAGHVYYIGISGYHQGAVNYDPITGSGTMPGSTGQYYIGLDHTDLPPTVDSIEDVQQDEDTGPLEIELTGLSSGLGESQEFALEVFASNEDLVQHQLLHAANADNATLSLTFPEDSNGSSSVILQIMDSGADNILETIEDNQFFLEEFNVVINQINDAPSSTDGTYTILENQTLIPELDGDLYSLVDDPDGERLFFTEFTPPKYGELILSESGSFEYLPDPNFNRVDSFKYQVTDGTVTTDPREISIAVDTNYLWYNGIEPGDVNDDGELAPIDALAIINYLNAGGGGELSTSRENGMQAPFWDASRDNMLSSLDALVVINELNRFSELQYSSEAEGEYLAIPFNLYMDTAVETENTSAQTPLKSEVVLEPAKLTTTEQYERAVDVLLSELDFPREDLTSASPNNDASQHAIDAGLESLLEELDLNTNF